MALSTPIAITGRGMVSSLGNDVRTTCAAARAGVARPSELEYFQVLSPADGTDIPVTGYSAPLWTLGFEGESRLLRLLQGALKDLQTQVPDAPWHGRRSGFYLSLPDSNRPDTGINLFVNENDRTAKIAKLRKTAGNALKPGNRAGLIARAARLSGWPAPDSVRCVKSSGHTGIAECLAEAANELSSGEIEFAIVGGADTLLEEDTLNWLKNTARLKTPECPAGLMPGEAGAFLLLETQAAANARGAQPLVTCRTPARRSPDWRNRNGRLVEHPRGKSSSSRGGGSVAEFARSAGRRTSPGDWGTGVGSCWFRDEVA